MKEVNSFWHGDELTNLELLCISSFLKNGIAYSLYVYEPPRRLPEGIILCDANRILDRSRLFIYQAGSFNLGSVAGFSNLFRYTLLHQKGGWWVDTDMCYLSEFANEPAEMFFAELSQQGEFRLGTAAFKAPKGSDVLQYCLDRFAEMDVAKVVHGQTGPSLLTAAFGVLNRRDSVFPSSSVLPIPWWEHRRLFFDEHLSIENSSMVHFWNAMLDAEKLDKNADYPPQSAFERLKRKYL